MGMKETKKMLEIIEKQYRQANNDYNKQIKKNKRNEKILNIVAIGLIVLAMILFVTVK